MSMNRLALLSQRVFNVPLLITPAKGEMIMSALADRLGVSRLVRGDGLTVQLGGFSALDIDEAEPQREAWECGYELVDGIAVIEVRGTLVQRNYSMRPFSGMTGYDGLRMSLANALADQAVAGIVFDIDSPGGEVAGCFDLAEAIFQARAQKPTAAILTEEAYSAAYLIASAAGRIYVPRTGGAGSIGALAMLVDISRALDAGGVTVNVLQFGARKADGQEVLPLAEEARARFQARVDDAGELITAKVAEYRGLDPAFIRGLEAATFTAPECLALGLVDAIAAPDAAFEALHTELNAPAPAV